MSRPVVKESDDGERHDALNGENSQLQKRRSARNNSPRRAQDRNLPTLESGTEHAAFEVPS